MGIPRGVIFEHGVECHEELAHAGGDDQLEGFPGAFEAIGELFDGRVESSCAECSHVKSRADGSPPAGDGSFTGMSATVAIERGDTGESGDLLSIEASEFRKFPEEREGGGVSDTRRAGEEIEFGAPVIVVADEFQELHFDLLDLLIEQLNDAVDALADGFDSSPLAVIGLGGAHDNELPAPNEKLFEFRLFFRGFIERTRLHELSETGNDPGVDAIGLGENSQGLGEVADLAGIDDGDEMPGGDQLGSDLSMVGAGGFEDDEGGTGLWEATQQSRPSVRGVVELGGLILEVEGDIEVLLGDIDADETRNGTSHNGRLPVLRIRTRTSVRVPVPAAVRAITKRPTTILLTHGLLSPRHYRSVVGRRGAGCSAPARWRSPALRSRPHGGVHWTTGLRL